MDQLVTIQNEQPVTTSLKVAETYGKAHKSVMRAIRNLMAQDCSVKNLFEKSTYINLRGQEQPMFYMNRDGYTLLVMGFEGKDALQFKLQYMEAFNKMEAYIKEEASKTLPAPKTSLQVLQETINQMVEIEAKQLMIEEKQKQTESKVEQLELRFKNLDEEREQNGQALLAAEISDEDIPEMTMRAKINQLARWYGNATGTPMVDVWHRIYQDLYYRYRIQLSGQNKLDEAERRGVLEPIFNIVSAIVRKFKNKKDDI